MDPKAREQHARSLLGNPLLIELLEDMKTSAIRTWQTQQNPEKRDECWYTVRAINALALRIQNETKTPESKSP